MNFTSNINLLLFPIVLSVNWVRHCTNGHCMQGCREISKKYIVYYDCFVIYKLGKTIKCEDNLSMETERAIHIPKLVGWLCSRFSGMLCDGGSVFKLRGRD